MPKVNNALEDSFLKPKMTAAKHRPPSLQLHARDFKVCMATLFFGLEALPDRDGGLEPNMNTKASPPRRWLHPHPKISPRAHAGTNPLLQAHMRTKSYQNPQVEPFRLEDSSNSSKNFPTSKVKAQTLKLNPLSQLVSNIRHQISRRFLRRQQTFRQAIIRSRPIFPNKITKPSTGTPWPSS